MRAIYLQSVRSPQLLGVQGRFKLRFNQNAAAMDVFSQVPQEGDEDDEYEEDSFCVGSEFNESGMWTNYD